MSEKKHEETKTTIVIDVDLLKISKSALKKCILQKEFFARIYVSGSMINMKDIMFDNSIQGSLLFDKFSVVFFSP